MLGDHIEEAAFGGGGLGAHKLVDDILDGPRLGHKAEIKQLQQVAQGHTAMCDLDGRSRVAACQGLQISLSLAEEVHVRRGGHVCGQAGYACK